MIGKGKYEKGKSELFSKYVDLYSKADDKLAFIANLKPLKDGLTDKINFSRKELDNSLKKILDLLKPFRKTSGWDENEMPASGLLRWYAEGNDLFLRLARYYDFSSTYGIPMHQKAREAILSITEQTIIDQIHKDRIKRVVDELDTLARRVFRRNIINYFIEFIESRSFPEIKREEEQEDILKQIEKKGSNSDKLYLANDWLIILGNDIISMEEPTHEKILNRIQKDFPEFEKVPNEVDLNFTKGLNNLNKTSIDKALIYLFNQEYEADVKNGAVKKRFYDFKIW